MEDLEDCPLSDSERELVKAMATTEDHSDEHLACLSRFTEQSVKTMCRNIMHKLDVHRRGSIVLRCTRKGWVALPEETVEEIEERERKPVSGRRK